jgi:hypothetical protein
MFVDRYYDWYGKQLTKPRDVLQTLADKGYVPEFKDKNIAGLYESGASFLPKKIQSAFMAFPRATSTAMASNIRSLPNILEKSKGKGIGTLLTESIKASPQVARNAIGSFFNKPGQYQDYDWEKAYRELLPDTKFTQQFDWAKDTDDWKKGTNWLQKIAAPLLVDHQILLVLHLILYLTR